MKKFSILFVFLCAMVYGNAQVSVYIKLTPYSGTLVDENPTSTVHKGQIAVTTISGYDEQTLNIGSGSQSSGTGAGKVFFDPITFSKPVSVNSGTFFQFMCSGAAFKFVEIFYYNSSDQVIFKQTLSLAAVSSLAKTAASCSSGCPGVVENVTLQYGAEGFTYYKTPGDLSSGVSSGWNRVKNVSWNDLTNDPNP